MTKIEEDVRELKVKYREKFYGPFADIFMPGPDPFKIFLGYPGGDLENEKKILLKSLEEGKMFRDFEEAPYGFCEYGIATEYELDLINSGYYLNEETNQMEIVWNSRVYVELDDNGGPSAIGMNYALTPTTRLNIRHIIVDEMWSATYSIDGEDIMSPNGENTDYEALPKNTYAYVEKGPAYRLAIELANLAESIDISTSDLEDGRPDAICELINSTIVLY